MAQRKRRSPKAGDVTGDASDSARAATAGSLVKADDSAETIEALRDTERRYRELFENVSVGLLRSTSGPQGAFIDVNPAMVEMFEADSREQLLALHPSEIYWDEDQRRVISDALVAKGFVKDEVLYKTLKGRPIWCRIAAVKTTAPNGATYFDVTIEDVTERKRADEALRRKNAVFDASLTANAIADSAGYVNEVNDAFLRMWGYADKNEVVGRPIPHFVKDEDEAASILAAVNAYGSWEGEYTARRKDGTAFTAYGLVTGLKDETGKLTGYQTAVIDITERTTMEAALHKRVMELTCLFELSRLIERPGIDLDGILRGAAELLPSAFLHADVAGARIAIEGATFASPGFVASRWRLSVPLGVFGEPTGFLEVCYREERPEADNGPFLAEELALLKTVTQRLEHVVERYRALGRLQISEERFALAARGANDGIWDWDLMTDEMMLSPRWKSILGYDEDELTESVTTWLALLHPDDTGPVRESMSRYLAGEADSFERESRLRHKDGHYVPVLTRGFALRRESDGAALRFVGTNTDLTELKAVETSLRGAVAELRRSNQDLELFAYVASHDLQEPLRMVASYTQLLARRYADELDQDAQDFIGYAVDGATRMQRLIQDLLTYSRVTTRGAPSAPVDVRGALDEALRNLETAIAESGAVVTADDLPTVLGDRTQIVQLLQNLIGNGIKFRRPGVSPHVHLSARPDPDNDNLWVFQVADDGIGIDPKYADRMFAIFQRLQSRQEYPGTGIGLALCKRIVERHGGAIWLQPDLTDGTTINFTLPSATRQ